MDFDINFARDLRPAFGGPAAAAFNLPTGVVDTPMQVDELDDYIAPETSVYTDTDACVTRLWLSGQYGDGYFDGLDRELATRIEAAQDAARRDLRPEPTISEVIG
jgi:hypothetical protein